MSGRVQGSKRPRAIEPGATFTIAQAWDYGSASEVAAAPSTGLAPPAEAPKSDDKGPKVLAIAAVAGLGIGLYSMWRSSRRLTSLGSVDPPRFRFAPLGPLDLAICFGAGDPACASSIAAASSTAHLPRALHTK